MTKPFKFALLGARELENALAQLPAAVEKQVLRDALKKAALPVAVDAARMAPRSGDAGPHLADSIAVGTQLSPRQRRYVNSLGRGTKRAVVFVGPRLPHGHLVEFGTGERIRHSSGGSSGSMPAQPFMRPAWDANRDKALAIFRDEIWKSLARAAKRLRRQAEKLRGQLR